MVKADVCIRGSLFDALTSRLATARWILVTTDGWLRRGLLADFSRAGLTPSEVVVIGTPLRIVDLDELPPRTAEFVVAVGGGSAIDRGKLVVLSSALAGQSGWMNTWRTTSRLPERLERAPRLIAVPTLAGSGAERTPFATVWVGGRKRSIEHDVLRPSFVVLDPTLHSRAPARQRLVAKLDCFSHACEAVWNLNASPATDQLAYEALRLLVEGTSNLRAEEELDASVLAGEAIAHTRTAICHSISYALSAEMGLPHGLAATVCLSGVAKLVISERPDRARVLARGLGCAPDKISGQIAALLDEWGAADLLRDLVLPGAACALRGPFLDGVRSTNFCVPQTENDARQLAFAALEGERL